MEFAERTLVPAGGVSHVDDLPHCCRRHCRHSAVLNRYRCCMGRGFEEVTQRCGSLLGSRQRHLQAPEVTGDQLVPGGQVRGGDDGMDLIQGHVQGPEPLDDLGGRDLVSAVASVPGVGIDIGGFQQADAVVMAQRLDVEVRGAREIPDRQ
jgi:hypothetical protein